MSNSSRNRNLGFLLPYLALVIIHLLSGLQMEQPRILADELGYLGNARYLAGTAHLPSMQGRQFYHFGYSLFLIPAFWLLTEPVMAYKAAIVINALLISALYFPLYFILTSFTSTPDRTARWIAFVSCLYPSLILYSSYAWSESAYILFYALSAALFGKFLAVKSTHNLLLFSLVASFLYTIHPRALPVLAAVLLYLLVLTLLKAIPLRQFVVGTSVILSVYTLTRVVNLHLKAVGWAGGGEIAATKLASRLLLTDKFVALFERASGQVLYLSLATQGLFLVAVIAIASLVFSRLASGSLRRVLSESATGVPIFALITGVGVLLASCTLKLYSLHADSGLRGANFIHGRYNEAFAVLAIAFALAEYCRSGLTKRQLVGRAILVIAVILGLTGVVMLEIDDALQRQVAGRPGVEPSERIPPSRVQAIAVPGVYPLVKAARGLNLYPISLVVIASFLAITVTIRLSRRAGMALVMALFLSFAYLNHQNYLLPRAARVENRLEFASRVRRLGAIESISYDTAYRERGLLAGIQYLLPDTVFDRFDSHSGQEPASQAVISGNSWSDAARFEAKFVVAASKVSALWFLPGELQSRLSLPPYEGVILGAEQRLEFHETGFYRSRPLSAGGGRWTNGAATLRVPVDPNRPPRLLKVDTRTPGRPGALLQVLANGVELWQRRIPSHSWSKTFSLEHVPLHDALLIELNSDTFSPAEASADTPSGRRLGVVVTGIQLTAGDDFEDPGRTREAAD